MDMKVLMLTTSYPNKENPNRGIFVYKLVESLKNNGLNIDVLTINNYSALSSGSGLYQNLQKSFKSILSFPLYWIHFYFKIIACAYKYDLIHTNWGPTGFLALLAKPFHWKKIILTERSSQLINVKNKFVKMLLNYTYSHVNKLVVISNYAKREIINNYSKVKPIIIPNGIEVINILNKKDKIKFKTNLDIPLNSKIVLFVGRLTSIKCVDSLLKGFAGLKKNKDYLIIIGDGEDSFKLKSLAKEFGIENRVIFTGNIKHEEVYDYMGISDIFVLPSLMETGGNVLLEAMACGLPIISTKVGWAEDLVKNDYNGFIIKKNNSLDIKNKLELLLKDDKLLHKFKNNVLNIAKNKLITWKQCAAYYEKEYKAILE